MSRKKSSIPQSATAEFQNVVLNDKRLVARLEKIVAALEANPSQSFPGAMGRVADREGFYRFVRHDDVGLTALLKGHIDETVKRAKTADVVVVPIDKTTFKFSGDTLRSGLKRMQKSDQGFEALFSLAVTLDRAPLGVVDIDPLESRGKTDAHRWFKAFDAADEILGEVKPIYVADREADAYELLALLSESKRRFVVRASAERNVREAGGDAEVEALNEVSRRAPVVLTREVQLSRRSKNRPPGSRDRHPPREGRSATLSVRACSVIVSKPRKLRADVPKTLTLNVVHVLEENPPPDTEAVEWLLFTSLPIATTRDVELVVDAYRARWTIEEYFKVLKTGCAYEKRQLESKATLLNALGILVPIAWRLFALRHAAENEHDVPATRLLDDDELHVLRKISKDARLSSTPSVSDALRAIAALGGHIRQNGRPGWLVIWRGFSKLLERVEGYRLAKQEL